MLNVFVSSLRGNKAAWLCELLTKQPILYLPDLILATESAFLTLRQWWLIHFLLNSIRGKRHFSVITIRSLAAKTWVHFFSFFFFLLVTFISPIRMSGHRRWHPPEVFRKSAQRPLLSSKCLQGRWSLDIWIQPLTPKIFFFFTWTF